MGCAGARQCDRAAHPALHKGAEHAVTGVRADKAAQDHGGVGGVGFGTSSRSTTVPSATQQCAELSK